MTDKYFKQVCKTCGSEDVLCDAYAEWNLPEQRWEIQNLFDKGAYCTNCDGETTIIEAEISRKEYAAQLALIRRQYENKR